MNLTLPLSPEALKSRYRELLKKWHPDVNRNDPQAGEKTISLTSAMEALTGISGSSLSAYTGMAYTKEISRIHADDITITISFQAGELSVADWIYAANFAAKNDFVYLAGYSGRVLVLDNHGKGVRVYDIGAVPRRIIDTGDYLYLLTDTRLYVLREDKLYAIMDTFDGGDLIVAQSGFCLLESKRLRWFQQDGTYVGSILSKDPIRRVYHNGTYMVVETRQRRAMVQGALGWW
jgi:hypothetical protein